MHRPSRATLHREERVFASAEAISTQRIAGISRRLRVKRGMRRIL